MSSTVNNNNTENEHLLQHKWVLWFRPPINGGSQSQNWEESQNVMFDTETVEQFWRGFHKLPRITVSHPVNCDYSLFKDGVKPMWEDDYNKQGGRWTYTIERRQLAGGNHQSLPSVIEQLWLDVMLCIIGEGFEPHGDKIAGGVVGIRLGRSMKSPEQMNAKIHIWTKDASDVEANQKIGEVLKNVLHAPDGQLTYSPHDSKSSKGRGGYGSGTLKL